MDRRAYLIDPKSRKVTEIGVPFEMNTGIVIQLTPEGDTLHLDPHSPFESDIYPFIFNPLGLKLGRALVLGPPGQNPSLPLEVIERHITWVSCLMVCGGITSIIPTGQHK